MIYRTTNLPTSAGVAIHVEILSRILATCSHHLFTPPVQTTCSNHWYSTRTQMLNSYLPPSRPRTARMARE